MSRLLVGIMILLPLATAQEKHSKLKSKLSKKKAEPIDAWGRPDHAIAAKLGPKSARYYIWYDEKGWHLKTTAAGARDFRGTIRVKDGRIASCVSMGLKNDPKKQKDAWRVNAKRDELTFDFRTGRAADGFDLKVEGDDAELEFDLSIDNAKRSGFVFIGKGEQHPAENPFMLKTPRKPEKEKSKK